MLTLFCLDLLLHTRYNIMVWRFSYSTESEGITAGTFLPSTPCLVHGKTTPNFLEVWIRTPSGLLTEAIAKHFQTIKQ